MGLVFGSCSRACLRRTGLFGALFKGRVGLEFVVGAGRGVIACWRLDGGGGGMETCAVGRVVAALLTGARLRGRVDACCCFAILVSLLESEFFMFDGVWLLGVTLHTVVMSVDLTTLSCVGLVVGATSPCFEMNPFLGACESEGWSLECGKN